MTAVPASIRAREAGYPVPLPAEAVPLPILPRVARR
jgi:hypothetical protein